MTKTQQLNDLTALPSVLFQSGETGPLGVIRLAGIIRNSRGDNWGAGRRLGRYALVLSLRGECDYWDEVSGARRVRAGELFFLFPEISHRYGAAPGAEWDEFYMVFEGPLFDLWRSQGLLSPQRSFLHIDPVDYWLRRFAACILEADPENPLRQLSLLQLVLADAIDAQEQRGRVPWMERARGMLTDPGNQRLPVGTVARMLKIPFETFRKRFREQTGMGPAQFRSRHQLEEAARLLAGTALSGKEIAEQLGFADECHFSKRFKQITGVAPGRFRRRVQGARRLNGDEA